MLTQQRCLSDLQNPLQSVKIFHGWSFVFHISLEFFKIYSLESISQCPLPPTEKIWANLTFGATFLSVYQPVPNDTHCYSLLKYDLWNIKCLGAVLNETLRLYRWLSCSTPPSCYYSWRSILFQNPVPVNVRQSIKATTWSSDKGKKTLHPTKTR